MGVRKRSQGCSLPSIQPLLTRLLNDKPAAVPQARLREMCASAIRKHIESEPIVCQLRRLLRNAWMTKRDRRGKIFTVDDRCMSKTQKSNFV